MEFTDLNDELQKLKEQLEYVNLPCKPIKEVLTDIEKAIHTTHDAIANATNQHILVQNQYRQAKEEAHTSHSLALEAASKGEQLSAMQSLSREANQEKLARASCFPLKFSNLATGMFPSSRSLNFFERVRCGGLPPSTPIPTPWGPRAPFAPNPHSVGGDPEPPVVATRVF